ncbi:MAG: hypothetical protein PHV39_03865 [Methanomicrobium sp.]|nr:hypothetical protein [Methanomicrobium sp.]
MNILIGVFDYILNSLVLSSIVFGFVSVIAYLLLMQIKDEKIQLLITSGVGVLFIGASGLLFGANFTGSIFQTFGTVLIILTPVVAFKGYLQKKDILPAVFLASFIYPVIFQSAQFMCSGYYPRYLAVLGDIAGVLFLSLSAMSLFIFARRVFESQKSKKVFVFLLIFLIPAIIFSGWSVASASAAVLIFLSLNEMKKEFKKCAGIIVPAALFISAVIFALPWQYLNEIPCILNLFPIWIIPVVSVSLVSAGFVYLFELKKPIKQAEIVLFILTFCISVILLFLFGFGGQYL